ncbi:hypothetical protein OBBRIDRAFT_890722 [Obba rivulosa]|uniref:DRBM domain-containing protein n=1 Tax=Obba rivulosa TaxID=1052685 RepID=A0A8E2DGM1_9APHY|nr:hypothetical protein OBBRIDRAFT_890722 [Obba rivulosa]
MSSDGVVALNNYLQDRGLVALLLWDDRQSGPLHAPEWTSTCQLEGKVVGVGHGPQKQKARDMAAKEALKALTETEAG